MTPRDALLGISVALMWGAAFVWVEIGLEEFPPIFAAALRFTFSSLPFLFFVSRDGVPWRWIVTIGMSFVFMFVAMYVGMRMGVPAGLTSIVLQAQVLFTVLLAPLMLNDRADRWKLGGVMLGIAGIVLIGLNQPAGESVVGLILVVVAAFFYGLISIWMKMARVKNLAGLIVWVSLIPPLPLLALSFAFEQGQLEALVNVSLPAALSVLYTSAIGTVIPFILWGRLLSRYSAHLVAPFALLIPLIGMASAALFLGERFPPSTFYATILILGGLSVILWGRRIYERWSRAESTVERPLEEAS